MANPILDPIPLGVAGSETIPLKQYLTLVGQNPDQARVLWDEKARISYLASRLDLALDRPLTNPGSEGLARLILDRFNGIDLMSSFAEKILETLRDGQYHNRIAISPDDPRVAVSFLAWNGSHREVQSERYGKYLSSLFTAAHRLIERSIPVAGFLEIDAYVRDNPVAAHPGLPLDEVFQIDVEYSYLPGDMFGYKGTEASGLPDIILLNPDLCSPDENQLLRKLMARFS